MHNQIEQFIESIFPSQNVEDAKRRVAGQPQRDLEAKAKEDAEARQDMLFMAGLMLAILCVVSFSMVRRVASLCHVRVAMADMISVQLLVAWMLGARFDLVWEEIRKGIWSQPAPDPAIGHEEL